MPNFMSIGTGVWVANKKVILVYTTKRYGYRAIGVALKQQISRPYQRVKVVDEKF